MSLSLQVSISLAMVAQWSAPPSEPANKAFFRFSVIGEWNARRCVTAGSKRRSPRCYNQLYLPGRQPGPIQEAACWVHARRPFFAMADIEENARRKASGKKEI